MTFAGSPRLRTGITIALPTLRSLAFSAESASPQTRHPERIAKKDWFAAGSPDYGYAVPQGLVLLVWALGMAIDLESSPFMQ